MFAYLSRVIAVLALLVGVAQFALGWAIATGVIGPYQQALARYTTESSSGAVIDLGIRLIGFALALGALAEISLSLRKGKGKAAVGQVELRVRSPA